MDKTWLTLDDVRVGLGNASSDSPLNSFLSWLSGRYSFERCDLVQHFSPRFGPSQNITIWFSIESSVIPDEKEISIAVRDFLFKLENPMVDAYPLVTAKYLLIVIIRSLG
jgi:hypothetical protein